MEIYSTCFGKSSDLLSIGNLHEKLKYLLLDGASEKMLQNWIYELHPSHIHWLNELIPFTSTPGKKLATSVYSLSLPCSNARRMLLTLANCRVPSGSAACG